MSLNRSTSLVQRAARALNAALDRVTDAAAWLALPLVLLLFAQWPLRDLVGAGSRPANDAAQCTFALLVAFAVRHATRQHAHLAADTWAARRPPRWRRAMQRWGQAACVLPWSLFVVVAGWPMLERSVLGLEAFPDTFNPGYFIVKFSAWLLALLMALQSLVELLLVEPETR